MRNLRFIIAIVLLGILFTGCRDEYENLTSNLNVENSIAGVVEGEDVIFNLSLDTKLSESLVLDATFSTDNIIRYANDEDYVKELSYSTDGGITWLQETDKLSVQVPPLTRALKVRVATTDDKLFEISEEEVKITLHKNSENIKLANEDISIGLIIIDDDNPETNTENLVDLTITNNETFKIKQVANIVQSEFQKEVIDKEYLKVVELFNTVVLENTNVNMSDLSVFDTEGLGGYTGNNSRDPNSDEYIMGLNVGLGFYEFSWETFEDERIPFNSSGELGYIIVHEFAHVLSTNATNDQLFMSETQAECAGYYEAPFKMCFPEGSYISDFYNQFYLEPSTKLPLFVTDYAGTQLTEDFAETFAFYIVMDEIPPLTEESSLAVQKIHFIDHYTEFSDLRHTLRNSGITMALVGSNEDLHKSTDANNMIMYQTKFNKVDGEFIPCQEVQQALKDRKEKEQQ